uniref:Laminin N-terminal domain-containing protein n=1 Tax=Syphacia muris TaxID=451379 RepID=A0A158R5V7_9BILA
MHLRDTILTVLTICQFISPLNAAYYSQFSMQKLEHNPCYQNGRPVHCIPDFINAAFGKPVIASSTCGQYRPSRYCSIREQPNGVIKEWCDVCDSTVLSQSHPASLLTDLNNPQNLTCWVSEPSSDYPNNVTLTLSLGKKFEITYVSLQFCYQLADSMAIYKSMDYGKTWIPFQYYSSECWKFYGKRPNAAIQRNNEQEAICTRASSSPLATRVAFATLEGRPSAFQFAHSPILQDWVTATDIKIVFNRLNPNQAELYGLTNEVGVNATNLERIQTRYFYSLSDVAVGGRCKCNGHASRCIYDSMGNYVCDCQHNTAGSECERCKLFHFDRPWARGTIENANACVGNTIIPYYTSTEYKLIE